VNQLSAVTFCAAPVFSNQYHHCALPLQVYVFFKHESQRQVVSIKHDVLVTTRHFTMTDTREFSRIKTLAQTCASKTFEKAAALVFFKIPRCCMTTTRKHFPYKQNITSSVVKTQLIPSQRKVLNRRVSGTWQAITERSRFESASRQ